MISESNFNLERNILSCPFLYKCNLPKIENLCNFPEYKICPEYDSKLKTLKASKKYCIKWFLNPIYMIPFKFLFPWY
ncbi:MAG: hypothetical protein KGD68_07685 [Candidatus Lokiarchaeota archaeon]|nr:hypothetical protein [Candidatus Lokiarchaeota archaeon]